MYITTGTDKLTASLGPETLLILPRDGSEIGVENLPLEVNETDVRTIFEEHGTIRKITSSKDIKSTKMVLLFACPVVAENALRKNGYHFKEINRVVGKEAIVYYFNRQCARYSFNKIGQKGFNFGDIKPFPSWIVTNEKKQTCVEALGKVNCESHVSVRYERLTYACWTCGRSNCVTRLCKERQHCLVSKEDYVILNTNQNAMCSRFPIHDMDIEKSDFIVNVDASCRSEIGFGVVIRRSKMEFFLNKIGGPYPRNNRTSYDAEALALEYVILVGLTTTTKGKLFIFTDCLPVAICFSTGNNISCGNSVIVDRELVNKCRVVAGLLPWIEADKLGVSSKCLEPTREVEVFHVYRELNQAADAVAKKATLRDSYVEDHIPIREIQDILEENKFLYRIIKKKVFTTNV